MNNRKDYLISLLKKMNIELSDHQIDQLIDYYSLLVEWNEKINLTAITEYEDVCLKHFADSFSIINLFNSKEEMFLFFNGKKIVDVGTGAGFPGICLKILIPELEVTLMDSLDKRIRFLNEVIEKLELKGITAIHARVEDFAKLPEYREQFDFATARAVAALPILLEYCIPFVKEDGYFISYKSEKADEEIKLSEKALDILGGRMEKKNSFLLPDNVSQRTLISIKKIKSTPSQYPRKAGVPTKKPL